MGEAVAIACKSDPGDVEIAVILADIYRNQPQLLSQRQQSLSLAEREKLADGVMDGVVAAKPKDAKVLLAHERYQLRYHPARAKEALATAIQQNPDDLEVVLQSAAEARRGGRAARRGGGSSADVQAFLSSRESTMNKRSRFRLPKNAPI